MLSPIPKVLRPVAGIPMIQYVLKALAGLGPSRTYVIVAPGSEDVVRAVRPAEIVVQQTPLGIADAIRATEDHIRDFCGDVLVVCGDAPMITTEMLQSLVKRHRTPDNPAITVLATRMSNPTGYGRLITEGDENLVRIVEESEVVGAERDIRLVNAGAAIYDGTRLFALLREVTNDNAAGEYYSTDMIEIAANRGWPCRFLEQIGNPILSVNTPEELERVERELQNRSR